MNDLISVIVPAYNAENKIIKCVKSLLSQTYRDIEIILINDGSTDNTLLTINTEFKSFENVLILNQQNRGVSYARNVGIDHASGKYVMFVDADDYFDEDCIKMLLEAIKKNDADIAVCNFFTKKIDKISEERFLPLEVTGEQRVFQNEEVIDLIGACIDAKYFVGNACCTNIGVPWGKLYKKNTIGNIRFVENLTNMEDMIFNINVFLSTRKIAYISNNLYYYTIDESTASQKINDRFQDISIQIMDLLNNFVDSNNLSEKLGAICRYKSLCLFYETISKQYLLGGNCNIVVLRKNMKDLNKMKQIDGKFHYALKSYYSKSQVLYALLNSLHFYFFLSFAIFFIHKLRGGK